MAHSQLTFPVRTAGYLRVPAAYLVLACGSLASAVVDPAWHRWLLAVVWLGLGSARVRGLMHLRRVGWAIAIDAHGVRWGDRTDVVVRWREVAEVRVLVARGWQRFLPHLPDRIALVAPAEARFAARAGLRPTGVPVVLATVAAHPDEIIDALRRWTDAPVVYGRGVAGREERT